MCRGRPPLYYHRWNAPSAPCGVATRDPAAGQPSRAMDGPPMIRRILLCESLERQKRRILCWPSTSRGEKPVKYK